VDSEDRGGYSTCSRRRRIRLPNSLPSLEIFNPLVGHDKPVMDKYRVLAVSHTLLSLGNDDFHLGFTQMLLVAPLLELRFPLSWATYKFQILQLIEA
jgi:hypothetical protein